MARTQIRGNQVVDGDITDADVATANKDGAAGTASMRTLGTGASQAAAGNHTHTGLVTNGNSHDHEGGDGGAIPEGGLSFSTLRRFYDSLLTGSAANFDITSIPADYSHLLLFCALRSDRSGATGDAVGIRFNNDSGSVYDSLVARFLHSGTLVTDEGLALAHGYLAGATAVNAPSGHTCNFKLSIENYAHATMQKTYHCEGFMALATTTGNLWRRDAGGVWRPASPAAISRVTIIPVVGSNFVAGSRVTLYLVK